MNIDNLPSDNPAPNVKFQSIKRQKIKWITKEEYEDMLNQRLQKEDELIKKMIKMSMNIRDEDIENDENIKHTFEQLFTKKKKEMNKEKKQSNEKLSGQKKNGESERANPFAKDMNKENAIEEEKIDDIYSIDQIYQRDIMSSQQRRFGSPDYIIRNDSMMFQLPTNNLNTVKPGVELIGGEKPLKGPKYNENPYFEWEEELTNPVDDSDNEQIDDTYQESTDKSKNDKDQIHQYINYDYENNEKHSITSKEEIESKSSHLDHPKELLDKLSDKPFVPKIQNLDNGKIYFHFVFYDITYIIFKEYLKKLELQFDFESY